MRTAISVTVMAFLVLCCNASAIEAPVITTHGGNGPEGITLPMTRR